MTTKCLMGSPQAVSTCHILLYYCSGAQNNTESEGIKYLNTNTKRIWEGSLAFMRIVSLVFFLSWTVDMCGLLCVVDWWYVQGGYSSSAAWLQQREEPGNGERLRFCAQPERGLLYNTVHYHWAAARSWRVCQRKGNYQ